MKLAATLLMLSSLSFAQSREQRLNQIFDELQVKSDEPGFAVLVLDHGKTVFERTAGVTSLRTKAAITPQTDFRLASCTKQFTAMAIMQLVHDGRLHYDDTLTRIFPEFPAYGKNITVRNLLNHSGGLPDYEDLMDQVKPNPWDSEHQITDAEVLRLQEQPPNGEKVRSPKFAPGTQWSYSNSGYVVLGAIVAKVSGMSFPDFLRRRIFFPLRLTNTVAFVRGVNSVPNRAYGHSKRNGQLVETDQSSTSATLGDGGVYSNLEDLAKWDAALAKHTLLSEEEMRPALTPFKLPDGTLPKWAGDPGDEDPQHGKPVAYGYGWFLDSFVDAAGRPHPRMWHYGDTIGFKSAIMRFDGGPTIIVLANRSDVDPAAIAMSFAAAYFASPN